MATEILRPQDILIERFRVPPPEFHRRKSNFRNGNDHFNPKSSFNNYRKPEKPEKKKHLITRRSASTDDLRHIHSGHVTILRRGESLDSLNSIIGPGQPESKQIRVGFYAGSAFCNSPSPRALPLPSFFNNKTHQDFKSFDDCATRDLRRLLRLEY